MEGKLWSFGTVWSARDEHGRAVAVKVVPLHAEGDASNVQVELEREITMMRAFRPRNIVSFHTAFRSAAVGRVSRLHGFLLGPWLSPPNKLTYPPPPSLHLNF